MEAVINDDLGDEDFSPLSNAFAKKIKNIDGPMIRSIVLISPWSKSVKFREKADVETCEPPVDSDGADDKPTVDMGSEFGNKVTAVNVTRAANGLLNSFASIANDAPCKKKVNFCSLTTNELVDHADLAIPLESIEEVNNRFVNTLYGYFIGKRLAFPIVENYVKNTWAKYGIERVMLKNDFFFFKFSTRKGMEQVLENGPWLIRTIPIILNTWDLNTILKKDEITNVPIWVKLHNIPVAAYSEVGLSLIGTMIGKPIMLDAYTCDMCLKLWGQTGYARALIEVSSVTELRDSLVIAIPFLNKTGHSLETIKIEYEWQPPRCLSCKIFGHIDEQCPKSCKAVTANVNQVVDEFCGGQ